MPLPHRDASPEIVNILDALRYFQKEKNNTKLWMDDVNTTYCYACKDFAKCCKNILYTFIYSPHCMIIFSEQKFSWKYTKVVVKPKVISCFGNKTENRGKNKFTLKLI